ncbi:MAG: hypothetical protein K1X75_16575 [Leptospirales bacterium]|nr:hypothetical protein [Leptospirales bacterium]
MSGHSLRLFWLASLLLLICVAAGLNARQWFVASPAARLNPEAPANAGSRLPLGAQLEQIGESGLFLRVRYEGRSGYVSRLFLSEYPPSRVRLELQGSEDSRRSPRRRASDVVETVAARGLQRSAVGLRLRGAPAEYDFSAVQWIEEQQYDSAALARFLGARLPQEQ